MDRHVGLLVILTIWLSAVGGGLTMWACECSKSPAWPVFGTIISLVLGLTIGRLVMTVRIPEDPKKL